MFAGAALLFLPGSVAVASVRTGRPPLPCPPRGQYVIAEDTTMRVYRPKITARNVSELPAVACVIGTRVRITLTGPPGSRRGRRGHRSREPARVDRLAIAGDVIAYTSNQLTGVDTSASTLTVADVAHRSILREIPAGYGVDAGLVFSEGVTTLAVTSGGTVAWIVRRSRSLPSRAAGSEVLAAGRTGPVVTLDEGPGVEPQSLYLSDGTANWVDDGRTLSAPLPLPSP